MSSQKRYSPECLTVSTGAGCNLSCIYCYSRLNGSNLPRRTLSCNDFLRYIDAAATIVAKSCSEKKIPFYFGVQGAGEPLLDFELIVNMWSIVQSKCSDFGLHMNSFITSNGTQSTEKYIWLSKHFSRICISVDGPPSIHNLQRVSLDPTNDFKYLINNLSIMRDHGASPICRSTITSHNAHLQEVMFDYLHGELGFTHIQFEPFYSLHVKNELYPEPEIFVNNFLVAQKKATMNSCKLSYSGIRLSESHGPYCTVEKNVLFITPSGEISVCPFVEDDLDRKRFSMGSWDITTGTLQLDYEYINQLQNKISEVPMKCKFCEINKHCVRGCPDICTLSPERSEKQLQKSPRCTINKLLYKKLSGKPKV